MKGSSTSPPFGLFLLFFIVGCVGFVMLVGGFLIPDWRANSRYVRGSCVVLDRRLVDSIGKFPGEPGNARISYHPEIKIRYEVDGRSYEVWTYDAIPTFYPNRARMQAIVDGFQVGASYPCWFDPESPEKAILVQGHAWAPYLLLVVPAAFLTVGIVGMGRARKDRGKTAQQRALERALGPDADTLAIDPERPNVPVLKLSGSSGDTLLVRLPTSTRPGRTVLGCLFFTLLWNVIAIANLSSVIAGRLGWAWGKPTPWPMEIVILLLALAGVGIVVLLIYYAFAEVLVALAVKPTTVEVSRHPLAPGGHCAVFVSQDVRRTLAVNSLRVLCVCEETTTRRDRHKTAVRRLYDQEILASEPVKLRPGRPLEARGELRIPGDARPSFVTADEQVRWRLVVKGDIARWPNFERDFPIVIQPTGWEKP